MPRLFHIKASSPSRRRTGFIPDAPRTSMAVRGWAAAQTAALAKHGWIPTDGLLEARAGPRIPLRAICFLNPRRGPDPELERVRLGPAAALVELLRNAFAELGRPAVWRTLL